MAINKPTAIQWKYNIQCAEVNGELKDFSSPLTEEQINTAVSEYETHLNSIKYKKDRAAEYPSIVDQLDDIYHNGINGWKATIKVTKDKYPKE
jgi:hypothetical protein